MIVALSISIYGSALGLLNDNSIYDIVAGAMHFLLGPLVYYYFRTSELEHVSEYFFERLCYITLLSYSIVILAMYVLPKLLGINIYLGLASQVLIFSFFYYLAKNKLLLSAMTLGVIFLSGKRGVFVALIFSSCVFLFPHFIRYYYKTLLKFLAISITAIIVTISISPELVDKAVDKFSIGSDFSLETYSSGRVEELSSAVGAWTSNDGNIVLGTGFGFRYTFLYSDPNIPDVNNYKNVHFSYINPIISFGVILGPLYLLVVLLMFFSCLQNKNENFRFLKWCAVSFLIYSAFVFNLYNEILLWMILGMIMKSSSKFKDSKI
ncbi:hypothetical protein G5S52_12655 [Grimontia sp. S25]|uniref:O-antigen ligase domain-containing protein n=1 Tax=Grimontia sedimenti TaxID=2711294 RepID=A0A6M1RQY0_9GAMM|nr:hypothetical protein [Grimontia sedimenti]NGN98467.1 hypothetical protein [Grimontia sedimenti]